MQVNFNWIRLVVNSCTNPFQMEVATNMVHLFRNKYPSGKEEDACFESLIECLSEQKAKISIDA